MVIWLIGLSGSGKSTIAKILYEKIKKKYPNTVWLDGDEVRKIYLCFDFLLPRISPNISVGIEDIENNILGKYINYLEDVKNNFDEEWIVFPGHEFPYFDPVKRASSLINHHENRLDLLYKSIKITSIKVKTAMDLLFGSIENDHDLFFAICETKAHLNLLVNNKKINIKKINNQIIYCN